MINNWTNKANEPEVTFPGWFLRLLVWTWNLRISFPQKKLLIMDNDITNAFRLLKLNPEVVPMHVYQARGYVGFVTGQSFGGCFAPPNFDPVARARIQQARYLWKHEPDKTMERARNYVANMQLPLDLNPEEFHTVAQANLDSLNTGVYEDCEQFRPGDSCRTRSISTLTCSNTLASLCASSSSTHIMYSTQWNSHLFQPCDRCATTPPR